MIKRLVILIVFAGILALQSCDKFLDLKPENVKVVSTIEDYRDILASYMRYLKTPNRTQMQVLGGYNTPLFDIANNVAYRTSELNVTQNLATYYDATTGEYTSTAIAKMTWMETADQCWSKYYSFFGTY